jgi:hypothetical protein
MRRLTACASIALALAVTGCGTTVPLTQTVAGGQVDAGQDLGLGQAGPSSSSPSYQAQPGGSTAVPGGVGGTGTTGGVANGTTGQGTTGTTGSTGGLPITGRGVSATTITIGAAFATGSGDVASMFGISGAGALSEQDLWNALVADLNKSGGILGRKVQLYVHPVDLAGYVANPAQTIAEVCADFRDDHKVFVAMISISAPDLRKCMADMGTPLVVYDATVGSIVPAAAFREHQGSYLYVPNGIASERLAELFVKSLMARSFTEKWDTTQGKPGGIAPTKLGLIHADTPDENTKYAAYARELGKYGLAFSDTVTYSGDVSTALATTQSAVLKFSSEGITHVFGASAFFLRDAESQHYRPRYAYLPALGAFGAANSPPEQMNGAMTVGWAPTIDVNQEQDPGDTAGAAHCRAVMRAAGLTATNRQDQKLMYAVCDALYSFRAALTASQAPSVPGLRRGYEALGGSFKGAQTFASLLAPNHHYGVDSVRDVAYDTACTCLKYTSKTNRS